MANPLRRLVNFLGSHTGGLLIVVALIAGGAWGFVELMGEVREGDTRSFDQAVIEFAMRHEGSAATQSMVRDVTALGGFAVLTLLTAAVCGYLVLSRKYAAVLLVLAATVGGGLLNTALKHAVGRERPPEEGRLMQEPSFSFPSGHAMLSSTVYLTLGVLLARLVPQRAVKLYFISTAILLSVMIGASRVWLRVHWPTDVLAGWSAGITWALVCWLATRWLQRRHMVERDTDGDGVPDA
ncbi:MAG TPA: phosphatase PAP2 family protein [Tepidisphaeraceae bacterium]|nr:phosphatase PAP2 family protein [Tepidisphaeraceae bacterium]